MSSLIIRNIRSFKLIGWSSFSYTFLADVRPRNFAFLWFLTERPVSGESSLTRLVYCYVEKALIFHGSPDSSRIIFISGRFVVKNITLEDYLRAEIAE